ncbi:MAG: response regulator, partial [Chloroflexi bacterium]
LAILDMHMPDMDGLMLAAEIRQYRDPESLPLVMLTSVGGRRQEARDLGFAAYLTKPIKPSQLYNALVSIFAGQPVRVRESVTRSHLDPQMAQRRPLRILLAEDNAVNQKVALRLLARLGYRADVAGNGFEALQALERQPYDVVLMDVQMPEMDGVEATRRIRERWPDNQRPRIIAMTAHALSGDRERYLAAGMDDYISKPVRVEELVAALERAQRIEDAGYWTLDTCPEPGRRIDGDERRVSETTDQGAPIPNNQSPINGEVLAQFTEMLGEDAPELIETYMEDATRLLEEMRAAAEQGDVEKLERAAHALKGSSATLGAELLSALCQELESMGRAGTLDGAAEQVADAQAEYERVRLALERGRGGQ